MRSAACLRFCMQTARGLETRIKDVVYVVLSFANRKVLVTLLVRYGTSDNPEGCSG